MWNRFVGIPILPYIDDDIRFYRLMFMAPLHIRKYVPVMTLHAW